ncbi:MAG: DUF835 domain-containing protein, partial [Candidatus Thermoplasmatota archaeon]
WNYSFEPLPTNEANFIIYIRAVDNATNVQINITINITYDITKPPAPTLIAPTGTIDNNTPKLEWTSVVDALSGLAYYKVWILNATNAIVFQAQVTTNSTDVTESLIDGDYSWYVRVYDRAGNWNESLHVSFTVSTGAPPIDKFYINYEGAEFTNITQVTLYVNSSAAWLWISNDGNTWSDPIERTSYETSHSWNLISGDGLKKVWIRCANGIDLAVYKYSIATATITLDQTPPTTILISPADNIWSNTGTVQFKWQAWDATSGLNGTYQIRINNSNYDVTFTIIGTTTNNVTIIWSKTLADGNYYWRVRAFDLAGNWGTWSETRKIKIDTYPPSAPILEKPQNNSVLPNNIVQFSWPPVNDIGANPSGVKYYILRIYEWEELKYELELESNFTELNLTDSTYYWQVRAIDLAGNFGNWSTRFKFEVNTGGPRNISFTINADATETNTEDVYLIIYAENTYEIRIWNWHNNEVYNITGWRSYISGSVVILPWKLWPELPNGEEIRTVFLECRSRNLRTAAVNDTIKVRKIPPIVTIVQPSQITNLTTFPINWTVDYPSLVAYYEVFLDGNCVASHYNEQNYTYSLTPGSHILSVRAIGTGGEVGGAHSICVFVDVLPPKDLEVIAPEYTNSTLITINLGAIDINNVTPPAGIDFFNLSNNGIDWHRYGAEQLFVNLSWDLAWDVGTGDGYRTIYFMVWDKAGNWNSTARQVFLDRVKPENLSISLPAYTNSLSIQLSLSANDPTPSSGLWQMCFSNDNLSWSDWEAFANTKAWNLAAGIDDVRTVYFKVRDRAGNENYTFAQIILDRTLPKFASPVHDNLTEDSIYANITVEIEELYLNLTTVNLTYWFEGVAQSSVKMILYSTQNNKHSFYYNTTLNFNASQGKNFNYKISCYDLAGNYKEISNFDFIEPLPDIPELIAPPDNGIVSSNVAILRWSKNATDPDWFVVKYDLRYGISPDLRDIPPITVDDITYVLYNLAHDVTYYWQVRAKNASELSDWSPVWSFTIKLIDLSISAQDISFEPSNVAPVGAPVTITAIVHNIGEADAENVYVEFYDVARGRVIGNTTIQKLGKGKNTSASITYPFYEARDWFTIRVTIDPYNALPEIAEDNNHAETYLKIVKHPDAWIVNITVGVEGKEYIFDNDTVKITAKIINRGGEISILTPFYVEFWLGKFENNTFTGTLLEELQVLGLGENIEKELSITRKATAGDWTVMILLNTTKIPSEKPEGNLEYKNFTVFYTTAVVLEPLDTLLSGRAGEALSYRIRINNVGYLDDIYELGVEDLPKAWEYSFLENGSEIKNVSLRKGEEKEFVLKITVTGEPKDYKFRVVATSKLNPKAVYRTDKELVARIVAPPAPFPWYLVAIVAIVAIALAAVKGLVVVVKPPKPRKAEKGYNYLVEDATTKRAYEIFSNFAKELQLLCLTSVAPRKIITAYPQLEKCDLYWLTDITTTEERTLHPERLEFEITKTIIEFVRATKGAIMIDGIEYLIQTNGLERTLEFFSSAKDIVATSRGTLIVPINPAVFKKEELARIEKIFDRVI